MRMNTFWTGFQQVLNMQTRSQRERDELRREVSVLSAKISTLNTAVPSDMRSRFRALEGVVERLEKAVKKEAAASEQALKIVSERVEQLAEYLEGYGDELEERVSKHAMAASAHAARAAKSAGASNAEGDGESHDLFEPAPTVQTAGRHPKLFS